MICDICNKNPATVHLTEIVDDQMTELHLCESCARQKSESMESQFGLSDLLAGMAEFSKPATQDKEDTTLKCKKCGLTYADFKKVGRLGCNECYESFKKYLGPLLKRIHGSNQHFGKSPYKSQDTQVKLKTSGENLDLAALREKLKKAVDSEAFEEAARLRDQIREIENKSK